MTRQKNLGPSRGRMPRGGLDTPNVEVCVPFEFEFFVYIICPICPFLWRIVEVIT